MSDDVATVLKRFRELADKSDRVDYDYCGEVCAAEIRALCDRIEQEEREDEARWEQETAAGRFKYMELLRARGPEWRSQAVTWQREAANHYALARRLLGIESEES